MARKPYLEFSVADRHASSRMYGRMLRSGETEPVDKSECVACKQTEGQIEAHREDYSWLGNESLVILCYRCHRVLHMRDRWPDEWDYYREQIRQGWQWNATKSIGYVSGDMKACSVERAKRVNPPRERTALDDIHDGILLIGTPEERQKRMEEIHELNANWKSSRGTAPLF